MSARQQRRSILVVGASGTLGSATARALAAKDVGLGLHYCSHGSAAASLQAELKAHGCDAVVLQNSLTDEADCQRLVEQFYEQVGGIDGLVLCGGRIDWKTYDQLHGPDWHQVFFEHAIAPFFLTRTALARMLAHKHGRVVYLSSISVKYAGSPKTLHYAAAKAALETTMRGLARQTAEAGIRINGVRAGFVMTPLHRSGRTPEELQRRQSLIPVGRAGRAEEIASAIVYLMSAAADFITGEILTVAGGD